MASAPSRGAEDATLEVSAESTRMGLAGGRRSYDEDATREVSPHATQFGSPQPSAPADDAEGGGTLWGIHALDDDLFATASPFDDTAPSGPDASDTSAVSHERTSIGLRPNSTVVGEERRSAPAVSGADVEGAWMDEIHRYLRGDATADEAGRAVAEIEVERPAVRAQTRVPEDPRLRLSSDVIHDAPILLDGAGILRRPKARSGGTRVREAPHAQREPAPAPPDASVAAAETLDNLGDAVRQLGLAETRPLPRVAPGARASEPEPKETATDAPPARRSPPTTAPSRRVLAGGGIASPAVAPEASFVEARAGRWSAASSDPGSPSPTLLVPEGSDASPASDPGQEPVPASHGADSASAAERAPEAGSATPPSDAPWAGWTPQRVRRLASLAAVVMALLCALALWGLAQIL